MGYTIFEKILLAHSSESGINIGDIIEADIDRVMIHDFFAPFCINKFNEMGFKKVFDPGKVVFIFDHLVPISFADDYRHHKIAEEFVRLHKITHIHRSDGVCHQLMHEKGYVKPGDIVLGTDSHTVTYGALGVLSTGIGYTEMASVLGTGKTWLKVVPTIRITIEGKLPKGVFAKDVILKILSDLGTNGATYKILEFAGTTIKNMSVDSRLTLSNMSVEAGAKAGIIEPDQKTIKYLNEHHLKQDIRIIKNDDDAVFEQEIRYRAEDIPPLVACPHNVDNVKPVTELGGIMIDQAFLGSCTNGRLEDIEITANILKGKQINSNIRFYVVPASREIYHKAIRKGFIQTIIEAGAVVNHPACSLCAGRNGGILENGERIISTNNRNFLGRMGANRVEIFLASPATVAASALEGKIADPRKYIG